jgi:hypothetical protein
MFGSEHILFYEFSMRYLLYEHLVARLILCLVIYGFEEGLKGVVAVIFYDCN